MNDSNPDSMPEAALFTDGACSGNPGPGGWAYILRTLPGGEEEVQYGGDPATTNNRMELMAVIEGLRGLSQPTRLTLYSDSQYVLKGLSEWMDGWKRRGWKRPRNQPVLNVELWQELDKARRSTTSPPTGSRAQRPSRERALRSTGCPGARRGRPRRMMLQEGTLHAW